jgi:hypothetical protein
LKTWEQELGQQILLQFLILALDLLITVTQVVVSLQFINPNINHNHLFINHKQRLFINLQLNQ